MAGEEGGWRKAVEKTKKRKVKTMPGIQMALLVAFPSANFSPPMVIFWLLLLAKFLLQCRLLFLVAAGELVSPRVVKYWRQRYSLFSRYDEGIAMDEEGWFSVTPEEVAAHQAELCGRVGAAVVVDGFSGVGGNAIQFAKRGYYVVAMEIDPRKVEFGRHNAEIYGVEDSIDFVVGDFLRLAPTLKGDVVFLSPPWGGPDYSTIRNFTLDFLKPEDGYSIFQLAQRISPNIIMFLPRNVDRNQLEELSWLSSPPLDVEIEESYVGGYLKGITVCFGDLASKSCT